MTSDQTVTAAPGVDAHEDSRGIFANRDFAKLWAGETISQIGTQVTQFALPLVAIISLHATVLQVGVRAFAGSSAI